jgi:ribonucleoside-triphosphate reductase
MTKVIAKNGKVGEGIKFERIRRITGYLVGTLDRFNDGKMAEVKDRVKHETR